MTDPHVTKLSSVPTDRPNKKDNNNTSCGRKHKELAQFKWPILNESRATADAPLRFYSSSSSSVDEVLFFRYVIKALDVSIMYSIKQRPLASGSGHGIFQT